MLLVGYCFGIRSERHLCEEVHLNLCDIAGFLAGSTWLIGKKNPRSLHLFGRTAMAGSADSELLRHLFETTGRALTSRKGS